MYRPGQVLDRHLLPQCHHRLDHARGPPQSHLGSAYANESEDGGHELIRRRWIVGAMSHCSAFANKFKCLYRIAGTIDFYFSSRFYRRHVGNGAAWCLDVRRKLQVTSLSLGPYCMTNQN
jgi:hypothetical protein